MRRLFALGLVACGTRTELRGEVVPDTSAPALQIFCHPGDAPVVLATTGGYGPLATDGAFVYGTPLGDTLSVISATGGEMNTIWPKGASMWIDIGLAANDGVYFGTHAVDPNAPNGEVDQLVWMRHDGLASRTVREGAVAPPVEYFMSGNELQVAPLDGSSAPQDVAALSIGPYIGLAVTDAKVYVRSILYDDCDGLVRIDRGTGTMESFTGLELHEACFNVGAVGGPNAVCSDGGCMLDEQTTPIVLHGALALDATYAYAARSDGLHRVELRGDGDDIVTPLKATGVA